MNLEERRHFRDDLRAARLKALEDAEGFQGILAAIERLGAHLLPREHGLSAYERALGTIAADAPSQGPAGSLRSLFTPFGALFHSVRRARNEALHVGTFARHLTNHCIHLALILEEGLMSGAECIADFMVRDPVCVAGWQPVAFARHQMLLHSFSYLPVRLRQEWHWISDHAVATFISERSSDQRSRREALSLPLGSAIDQGQLTTAMATVLSPETLVADALRASGGLPVLIAGPGETVAGIATAFDLL